MQNVEICGGGNTYDVNQMLFKTSICTYWQAGTCGKDKNCVYAHGKHELRPAPKYILCQNFMKGNCSHGNKVIIKWFSIPDSSIHTLILLHQFTIYQSAWEKCFNTEFIVYQFQLELHFNLFSTSNIQICCWIVEIKDSLKGLKDNLKCQPDVPINKARKKV